MNDCLLFKRLTVQATSDPSASPLFAEEQVFVESMDKSVLSKSKSCLDSDGLDNSREAEEESKLTSVRENSIGGQVVCQTKAPSTDPGIR